MAVNGSPAETHKTEAHVLQYSSESTKTVKQSLNDYWAKGSKRLTGKAEHIFYKVVLSIQLLFEIQIKLHVILIMHVILKYPFII